MPGLPVNAPTDALLTIAPLPWRSICRSSCFMQAQTPRRLTPITRSHSSRVLSAVLAIFAMTPALLNAASSRAELGDGPLDHRLDLRVIAHVTADGERLVASRDELVRRRLHGVFLEVREHN